VGAGVLIHDVPVYLFLSILAEEAGEAVVEALLPPLALLAALDGRSLLLLLGVNQTQLLQRHGLSLAVCLILTIPTYSLIPDHCLPHYLRLEHQIPPYDLLNFGLELGCAEDESTQHALAVAVGVDKLQVDVLVAEQAGEEEA
jgi:hypothetical protein